MAFASALRKFTTALRPFKNGLRGIEVSDGRRFCNSFKAKGQPGRILLHAQFAHRWRPTRSS